MLKKVLAYIPAAFSLLFGMGLQLSGATVPLLGYTLMGLSVGLLIIPAWPWITRIGFQSPVVIRRTPIARTVPPVPELQEHQSPRSREEIAKIVSKLDEHIQAGHKHLRNLRIPHDVSDVQPSASHWLEQIQGWSWESVPEHADLINGADGDFSADERMRNAGVDINLAALRITIERRLTRLRQAKALLSNRDRATNQRLCV